ncbi:acyltransferase family protein [Citrobacter sp. CK205]|uniref:acyltransferase family protein n=1 Tax=Citrobacter sp. CK205 TaxID=2985114 RepID=UPI00257533F7|nr:acyltransferase [Citrobacter sp. CK205]MDM3132234.1 acyltransferase [Citrobacter sp. CK205]
MRIHSIDYGRGVMALSILFYHIHAWTVGTPPSETLLGKLGVYGVSVFFVISGMSMYISYKSTNWTLVSTISFFVRRFFRLAPVYWIALSITFFYACSGNTIFNYTNAEIWNNILLTFGVFDFSRYIVTGGWSIGNEVVFYIFFPLLIIASPFKRLFILVNLAIMYVYVYYCFVIIKPGGTIGSQWVAYINPLNQAFLFSSGVVLAWGAYIFGFNKRQKIMWWILISSSVVFAIYPVVGDKIAIISGWNRVYITGVVLIWCYALLNIQINTSNLITRTLAFLGDVSYPVYLLHGIMFVLTDKYIWPLVNVASKETKCAFFVFVFVPVLLLMSWFVFVCIEKPIIKLAKRVTRIDKRESLMQPSEVRAQV